MKKDFVSQNDENISHDTVNDFFQKMTRHLIVPNTSTQQVLLNNDSIRKILTYVNKLHILTYVNKLQVKVHHL